MARQPRKTGVTPRRRKSEPRAGFKYKWLVSLLMPVILVAAIGGFSYISYLDYTVRDKFEGKRWSIPARVYASPVELYAGYPLSAKSFTELLIQLHYRQDSQLSGEGSYFVQGPQVNIRTHSFNFGDTAEESHHISVSFEGENITRITAGLRARFHAMLQASRRVRQRPSGKGKLDPRRTHGIALGKRQVFLAYQRKPAINTAFHTGVPRVTIVKFQVLDHPGTTPAP